MTKVVELQPAEFQKLLLEIQELKALVEKLENANKFLNDEIREYNKQNQDQDQDNKGK